MIKKKYAVIHFMAEKKWYLAPVELYLILVVRSIRLELGISGEEISKHLKMNKKYIGNIESSAHNAKYNDEILSSIALYFTQIAKEKQNELSKRDHELIKTDYTIYDFYPAEILSDEKVIKKIDPIPIGSGPTGTLNALIESTNFFKTAKALNEIVAKANKVQNQNWEASNFTQPLENAVKGKNKRLDIILKDGLNTYILAKKQKKV